jgi:hypothetical protein
MLSAQEHAAASSTARQASSTSLSDCRIGSCDGTHIRFHGTFEHLSNGHQTGFRSVESTCHPRSIVQIQPARWLERQPGIRYHCRVRVPWTLARVNHRQLLSGSSSPQPRSSIGRTIAAYKSSRGRNFVGGRSDILLRHKQEFAEPCAPASAKSNTAPSNIQDGLISSVSLLHLRLLRVQKPNCGPDAPSDPHIKPAARQRFGTVGRDYYITVCR